MLSGVGGNFFENRIAKFVLVCYNGGGKGACVTLNELLGETVTVTVDRPLGSRHPRFPDLIYTVNYGYIDGLVGGDGEWQDAYILGVSEPISVFSGRVIAIIHRTDDVEDKLVVAPDGMTFTREQVIEQTLFQERYFNSTVKAIM